MSGFFSDCSIVPVVYDRLRLILDTKWRCDLTIHLRNKRIQAHKLIIAMHSPVLEDLIFGSNGKDGVANITLHKDTLPDFDNLLRYMYGDIPNNSIILVPKLKELADKYQIEHLQKAIYEYLEKEALACIEDTDVDFPLMGVNIRSSTPYTNNSNLVSERLKMILCKKWRTDLKIHLNNETIKAHRLILAMHSPVFEEKIFGRDGTDECTELTLSEDSPCAFKDLLCCMYGFSPKITDTVTVCQIKKLADKYQIRDLSTACMKYIDGCEEEGIFGNICNALKELIITSRTPRWTLSLSPMSERLSRIQSTGWRTDIRLLLPGLTLKAHRLILAMHSPVLDKKIYGKNGKDGKSSLLLFDESLPAFCDLLGYMYGAVPKFGNVETAKEVKKLAIKYEMRELQTICEEYIETYGGDNTKNKEEQESTPKLASTNKKITMVDDILKSILNTGWRSDLSFLVNKKYTFKVHRLIVALHAPGLNDIVYSSDATDVIAIDCEHTFAFCELLGFMYGFPLTLRCRSRAKNLFGLARKYKMEYLMTFCNTFLQNHPVDDSFQDEDAHPQKEGAGDSD